MAKKKAIEYLATARSHLDHVQTNWDSPEWSDLCDYSYYCLEAAVSAAMIQIGRKAPNSSESLESAIHFLHTKHSLPDISDLLSGLDEIRDSISYGELTNEEDVSLDPEDIANLTESYVEGVAELIGE